MEKELIYDALTEVAKKYTESKATTNAGVVLRTIVRFLPVSLIVKLLAAKLSK